MSAEITTIIHIKEDPEDWITDSWDMTPYRVSVTFTGAGEVIIHSPSAPCDVCKEANNG